MEPDCMYEYRYDRSEPFIKDSSLYANEEDDDGIGYCRNCSYEVDEFELEDGLCPYCYMMEEEDD